MTHQFLRHLIRLSIATAAGSTLLLSSLGTAPAHIAHASNNVITVNSLSDSAPTCAINGVICLRNAIGTAENNSTPTTINFSLNGSIPLGSTLTITTTPYNPITIDGTGKQVALDGGSTGPANGIPIMVISAGSGLSIHALTFANGNAQTNIGGAIINNGSLNISSSLLLSDSAAYGGAIFNRGTLFINSDTFSSDAATTTNNGNQTGGGALYTESGTVSINNSYFSYNNATSGYVADGGAIAIHDGVVSVTNSIFNGNSASTLGGAISITDPGSLSINTTTLSGNSAGILGGAIDSRGTLSILNSTLSGNSVNSQTGSGGALLNNSLQPAVISNSTFSGNNAANGGAIDNVSSLTLGNSTFSQNTGFYKGGALNGENSSLQYVFSNVFDSNTTAISGPNVYAVVTSLGYNLINDANGSVGFTNINDKVGVSAGLGNLSYNGGSTQTLALTVSSPAVGSGNCAGNQSVIPNVPAVAFDQRAVSRKNPTGTGTGCDIGAFDLSNTDTIGIYRTGTFYLRLHNSTGNADLTVNFHPGNQPYPIVGDWSGTGLDTVGVYDQSNGAFILCTTNNTATCVNPAAQVTFVLGNPNDMPLAGRWKFNTSASGVGVFRPSNGILYMKHSLSSGYADYSEVLGIPGDRGLAGDWTDKGYDSPGVYRPAGSIFYLSNKVTNGSVYADVAATYGLGGDAPVAGDWIAQGHDGIGLFRQTNGYTYLKNALTTGYADNTFTYGIAGDIPVAGHWQGTNSPASAARHATAPPILIPKSVTPQSPKSSGSISGSDQIGD